MRILFNLCFLIIYFVNIDGEPMNVISFHFNSEHICSGVIISEAYILTTASCVCKDDIKNHTRNLLIHVGMNYKAPHQILRTDFIDCHPKFVQFSPYNSSYNNIAIVKMSGVPDVKKKHILDANSKVDKSHKCYLFVWGHGKLRRVDHLRIETDLKKCEQHMKFEKLLKDQFCIPKPHFVIRTIDQGTPIICNDKLSGIFSWKYSVHVLASGPYIFTSIPEQDKYFFDASKRFEVHNYASS